MTTAMQIPKKGELDLVALGALVLRLDPGVVPFRKATACDLHVSGGEYNVAADLADCFRMRTAVATAMVDYPVGDLITSRVRAMGVHALFKHFAHDGVSGPNMATVYSDRGHGIRGPVVFYNRANEAAARLRPGDFDWPAIFAKGVRWFHSGGIFAALSASTAELIVEAARAAKSAGAVVSFDLNYRHKLWDVCGGLSRAREVLRQIAAHVDVLFANEEDVQLGLGIDGPPGTTDGFERLGRVAAEFPNVRMVATTNRVVISTNRHRWSAVASVGGVTYHAPEVELDVLDRVGGGDGFASGFIFGLLSGESVDTALRLGWAHGALLTTFPGDTTMATVEQVRAVAAGQSARIQR